MFLLKGNRCPGDEVGPSSKNGKLLSQIVTTVGLKQSDNLSPILFNIFSDDVEEILDASCDPVIFINR